MDYRQAWRCSEKCAQCCCGVVDESPLTSYWLGIRQRRVLPLILVMRVSRYGAFGWYSAATEALKILAAGLADETGEYARTPVRIRPAERQ